jgi:two-component system, NtrC family, response regulator GlrR
VKARRIGALEEAEGGTVLLNEVGELPDDMQPKLLRVLENRELRRLGANRFVPLDVRVLAATNRDLRAEVNAGRFRSDLYFRLAVLKMPMPPLRARPDDIPTLVAAMLDNLGASDEARRRLLAPEFLDALARGVWPGNARELRNCIERGLVVEDGPPLGELKPGFFVDLGDPGEAGDAGDAGNAGDAETRAPFAEAKRLAQAEFERLMHSQRSSAGPT